MFFAHPDYLYTLLPMVLLLILFTIFSIKRKMGAIEKFASSNMLSNLAPRFSIKREIMKQILIILAITIAIIAAAGPQWGQRNFQEKVTGAEVLIALDASQSMMAEDYKPSRLEFSKVLLQKLTDSLKGNKIGVIAFAGAAYTICPLTVDDNAVRMFIDSIDYSSIPIQGTNIGDAIKLALSSFSNSGKSGKILIILSDGENLDGDLENIAKTVATRGIRIYTIGVGSTEGAQLKIDGEIKLDMKGKPVISKLDEPTLKRIAEVTNGSYTHATYSNDGTANIAQHIKNVEKEQLMTENNKKYIQRFQIPLSATMLILCVELLLSKGRRIKK